MLLGGFLLMLHSLIHSLIHSFIHYYLSCYYEQSQNYGEKPVVEETYSILCLSKRQAEFEVNFQLNTFACFSSSQKLTVSFRCQKEHLLVDPINSSEFSSFVFGLNQSCTLYDLKFLIQILKSIKSFARKQNFSRF